MEKFDPNRELQIWQRVAGGPQPENGNIRPLLLAAVENAAVLRHLTGLLTGKARERMKPLQEGAQRSVEALKGVQKLLGHPAGDLRPPLIPKEPPRRLLEKSFHRTLRLMTEYSARVLDPEYGVVYQALADRERKAAAVLAEVIGGLEK